MGRGNINLDHKSSHGTKVACSMWEVVGELARSSLARGLEHEPSCKGLADLSQ